MNNKILDNASCEQDESIAKSNTSLISLNTRISHQTNANLEYIWAMKQAEYNFIKFPKQLAVEFAINFTYDNLSTQANLSPHARRQNSPIRDSSYFYAIEGRK